MQALCCLLSLSGEDGQVAAPPSKQHWQETLVSRIMGHAQAPACSGGQDIGILYPFVCDSQRDSSPIAAFDRRPLLPLSPAHDPPAFAALLQCRQQHRQAPQSSWESQTCITCLHEQTSDGAAAMARSSGQRACTCARADGKLGPSCWLIHSP